MTPTFAIITFSGLAIWAFFMGVNYLFHGLSILASAFFLVSFLSLGSAIYIGSF